MNTTTVEVKDVQPGMVTLDGDTVLIVASDEWNDDVWVEFESGDMGYLWGSLTVVVD